LLLIQFQQITFTYDKIYVGTYGSANGVFFSFSTDTWWLALLVNELNNHNNGSIFEGSDRKRRGERKVDTRYGTVAGCLSRIIQMTNDESCCSPLTVIKMIFSSKFSKCNLLVLLLINRLSALRFDRWTRR